jgi:hypothetical protein
LDRQIIILKLSGFEDTPVQVEMFHVMGRSYGGHLHQIAAKYLGEFRSDPPGRLASNPAVGRATMILTPWEKEFTIIYKASDVCTRRKIRVNSLAMQQPIEFLVDVKYAVQLYDLNQYDTPNLELYTGDEQHPSDVCHFGTKELIEKLVLLDRKFGEALEAGKFDIVKDGAKVRPTGRKIPVNDMSLSWGGTFKIYGIMNRKGHHGEHMWGNCVDITNNQEQGITEKEYTWLKKEAPSIMGVDYLRGKGHGNHLHFNLTKRKLNQGKG